jgi:glucose-1-phosphate thymidylyltransferase
LPLTRPDDFVLIGLPDTIWFPEDGLRRLGDDPLSFLLFPVDRPELFDAVRTDAAGRVIEIQVKRAQPASSWIWGAFKLSGRTFAELHDLWLARERRDVYIAMGVRAGEAYVDVGTLHGYREAITMLGTKPAGRSAAFRPDPAVTG